MRRNCGKFAIRERLPRLLAALLVGLTPALFESTAWAGFLRQGVRPSAGDRIKTLRPPRAGTRDRIKPPGQRQATSRPAARKQRHEWFWQKHAPRGAADPARWAAALESLRDYRASGKPKAETAFLMEIRSTYADHITSAAARHNLSESLLLAVIAVESRGKSKAVSPKGAQGLMQLIPSTARRFGVTDPYDPAQNIGGGAAYLDWLLTEFRGDALLALAGYNAGEGAVRKHNGVPPYNETRDYVVLVLDAVAALESQCAVPPSSPRAICRWAADS